jgi:hypothetical protein
MPSLALQSVTLVTASHTLSSATSAPQRLSVWDERARKMGFPPSARWPDIELRACAARSAGLKP